MRIASGRKPGQPTPAEAQFIDENGMPGHAAGLATQAAGWNTASLAPGKLGGVMLAAVTDGVGCRLTMFL